MKQFLAMVDRFNQLNVKGDPCRLSGEICDGLRKAPPFVFNQKTFLLFDDTAIKSPLTPPTFAPPFPIFSIEHSRGPLSIFRQSLDDNQFYAIFCILCIEQSPNQYLTMANCKQVDVSCLSPDWPLMEKGFKYTNAGLIRVESFNGDKFAVETMQFYLDGLATRSAIGTQASRQTIKVGSGKNKHIRRIGRIIHVVPKKEIVRKSESFRHIDWSHRFEVRGHWRDLPGGLGKDREGNYCVKDHTWVTHYTKGPENLPLVKKTRLVNLAHDGPQP